jgi:hypothetical protein
MRFCFWTVVLALVASAYSFCETPEKVTACKLKNDPAAFNHKLVEVEGFISHAFEDFTFFDPNCPYSPEIWLEYGGKTSSGTIYCCGVSNARSRPKELAVDGVPIPLLEDDRFRRLDKLIHDEADTVVHATLVGRFFPGKQEKYANGKSGNWGGYGHMGCCSLLAIQQVFSVDPHVRDDLDYRATSDQPHLDALKCGTFVNLQSVPSARATFDIQHRAEAGENAWVFDDPGKVATSFLAESLRINVKEIAGSTETKSRGRVVFQWLPSGKTENYMVVVSRSYWLSFYAADDTKVAWVVIGAYKACGD